MAYQSIHYDVADDVATIVLNRPETRNGLTSGMRREITEAMLRAPDEARVLVLTGAGGAFCSGQDLSEHADLAALDLARTLREEYEPMLQAIYACPIPTIAAVNGAAAGAGANLALACDVVIAARSAVFIQAFARIGLVPDAGGTYWLPRQMGMAKAMGAALFADRITAEQADAWGMIWEAVADEAFEQTVRARAAQLAQGPTVAYRLIKRALRASFANGLEAQLALEAELQGEAGATDDFREGISAFLEKRPARYRGR